MPATVVIEYIDYWERCPHCHSGYGWASIYKPTRHLIGGLWEGTRQDAIACHVHRWVA